MDEREQEQKIIDKRLFGLGAAVVIVIGVLVFNLWRLQIANADYYTTKAQSNFSQAVNIPATRGDIVDRTGKVLVTSVPKFVLTLDWLELQQEKGDDWKEVIYKLSQYVKDFWPNQKQTVDSIYEDILATIQNHQWERYKPVNILESEDEKLRAIIAEHQEELPGISIEAQAVRSYPHGTLLGHILGYVREISDSEIDEFNNLDEVKTGDYKYKAGDIVGKAGVERTYDYWLRGREGKQVVLVDNNARPIDKSVIEEAENGYTVQLTLDAELTRTMEEAIAKVLEDVRKDGNPDATSGAGVLIDVNTGKILAMASFPQMDPNDLTGIISEETAQRYFTDEKAASLNRAISGIYPPGSTFKMIVGMAALQSGLTTASELIDDKLSSLGGLAAQQQGVAEWGGNYFGWVNLKRAIARSSNIYFQVIGARVFNKEPEMIKQISNEFGLGVKSGIDLPGEEKGITPSPEWKKANYGPYYEKIRDKKLAEIEESYAEKLKNAKDENERKKILQQKEIAINNVEVEYKQNVAQFVNWKLYDTYNASIGQGYNAYTPLQLANYVATIVNGGTRYKPYVVDKIINAKTGEVVKENKPTVLNKVSIAPEYLEEIKIGMRAVTDPNGEGTASTLFADVPQFTGGAKTGTAQRGSKDTVYGTSYNGVFVAFAPYDNPQVAFAGVIEYGGSGGGTAGIVAKEVFKKYFGWE